MRRVEDKSEYNYNTSSQNDSCSTPSRMQVFPPLYMYMFGVRAADMLTVHCRRLQGVYSARCRAIVFNQTEDKMCCD